MFQMFICKQYVKSACEIHFAVSDMISAWQSSDQQSLSDAEQDF